MVIKKIRAISLLGACAVAFMCNITLASGGPEGLPRATRYLEFSGVGQYVEIPSAPDLSFGAEGFTVSAWIKPDTLEFAHTEGSGYVYWIGKGEKDKYEWAGRMYSYTNRENPPRPNRISFYLFNLKGGLGEGSYVQEPVRAGQWIQITATANRSDTAIYRNGEYIRCDEYDGAAGHSCQAHGESIHPEPGNAPLRLGTRDLASFFRGGISQVRIWNRALAPSEIQKLFLGVVSRKGLVADFQLNEGSGDVIHDSTGKHEGRIVGARWAMLVGKPLGAGNPQEQSGNLSDGCASNPAGVFEILSAVEGTGLTLGFGFRMSSARGSEYSGEECCTPRTKP